MSASVTVVAGSNGQQVCNATIPAEGPRTFPGVLTFDGITTQFVYDFTLAFQQGKVSVLQSLWWDATNNPSDTTVAVSLSGQTFTIPGGSIGVLPLIAARQPKITFTNTTAGNVAIQLLNVMVPSVVYSPDATESLLSGAANAITVATGGTAVTPFPVGWAPKGGVITNPDSATEPLFVDWFATAGTASPGPNGTTQLLEPGSSLVVPAGLQRAVTVNAATAGHAFVAIGYS
jgi:hypothetical protein